MEERRRNWKEELGEKARQRAAKRDALLVRLDGIRREIQGVGCDWQKYDELKEEQRCKLAELATL